MNKFLPYKKNILIFPQSRNKIIGDTSKFYLFGEVLAVGSEVSKEIEVGDTIGYTLWGLTEILEADGNKHYFIQDSSDFILGVSKKNEN